MKKQQTIFLIVGYVVLGGFFLLRHKEEPPAPSPPVATAEWPYKEPRTRIVVTTKNVFNNGKPILYVFHDTGENGWQFLDASVPKPSDLTTATLEEMVKHDAGLHSVVTDLQPGWAAFRKDASSPWQSGPQNADKSNIGNP